jgi:DNA-binding MltR family transcriptional regulator
VTPADKLETERRSVFRQLAVESDRGAAIVGCSLLEDSLEQLLRSRMSKSADARHVDRLFSGYAPLATFSAKSALCYALGLIDESIFQDLDIMRKIRNRFAHEHSSKEFFDDETFRQLCAIQCTYPIGTPDYAGARVADLKQEVLEFHPADDQEPVSIELSGARAKFLLSVQLLFDRIRQQAQKAT